MFALLRVLLRSGGFLAASLALVGLAFYGIALLSVALVDEPGRAVKILAVFLLLSAVFCLLLRWTIRRAIAQARRPLDAARDATSRLTAIGGWSGREAIRALGEGKKAAGGIASWALGAADRAARSLFRGRGGRRAAEAEVRSAAVIPMRRARSDREAR